MNNKVYKFEYTYSHAPLEDDHVVVSAGDGNEAVDMFDDALKHMKRHNVIVRNIIDLSEDRKMSTEDFTCDILQRKVINMLYEKIDYFHDLKEKNLSDSKLAGIYAGVVTDLADMVELVERGDI